MAVAVDHDCPQRELAAARLGAAPEVTCSSTKATMSSGRRTAIWMVIPKWYRDGIQIGSVAVPLAGGPIVMQINRMFCMR